MSIQKNNFASGFAKRVHKLTNGLDSATHPPLSCKQFIPLRKSVISYLFGRTYMNAKHVLASVLLLAMAACGGGGDSGTPPTNEPPTLKFETTVIAVPKSSQTNLTVSASDPDGDA